MTPLEALQQTLAGEHAAVYVYGALGGRVSASAQPDAGRRGSRAAYTTHRGRRDQLTAMVRAAEGDPVAADVSYELPNPSRTAGAARRRRAGDRAALRRGLRRDGRQHLAGRPAVGHRRAHRRRGAAARLRRHPEDFPGVGEL